MLSPQLLAKPGRLAAALKHSSPIRLAPTDSYPKTAMAKDMQNKNDDDGNLLSLLMSQASDLDFSDPSAPSDTTDQDPRRLIVEGFE